VQIEAVCNIKNILCGPKGVANVYGPQKGATPEQVKQLSNALERFAEVAGVGLHSEIATAPGSGASGRLGAGIMLLGGRLRPRIEAIDEYFGLEFIFKRCYWNLVITAEGCIDSQSPQGKMTTEVARRAQLHGTQVVALAGTLGEGAEGCYDAGIQAFTSIVKGPTSLEDAMEKTEKLVQDGAEGLMRAIEAGLALGKGLGMHSLSRDC
jgi:glycerate kinase